ncbi:MAG TPA: hypothetical protein VFG87_28430 [Amycolatopsis sp.]|nr:hypothetical protein [Amycolatopsis sp.]
MAEDEVGDAPSAMVRAAPLLSLVVVLAALDLVINGGRLGLDLAGGRLLPVGDLGELWSTYFAGWHPVGGGTTSAAPTSLAVLGVFGAIFVPVGGPAALVAVVLLADAPLAGLAAYLATRRLPVSRWVRAGAASVYALLPPATAAVAQGRLDVVVTHILVPPVIAGIAGVLARKGRGLLHASSWCALGLALLGAFSPLALGLALLGLVVGFVVLPPQPRAVEDPATGTAAGAGEVRPLRRAASVAMVVLVPLALLLPWPTVLVNEPALLLHGLSGPGSAVTAAELVGLDPGGAGALPWGLAVVVAAVVAVVIRPRSLAGPGLGVVVLGVGALVVVRLTLVEPVQGGAAAPGFAGVPLLVIGAGLLWTALTAVGGLTSRLPRLLGLAWAVLVLAVGAGAVVGGRGGPLHAGGGDQLAAAEAGELARTGRAVLVLGEDPAEPARETGGRLPRYGDDQLALSGSSPDRLAAWQTALDQPAPGPTRAALSAATASGALFVVLPAGTDAGRIVALAPDLAVAAPPTRAGRPVLRLSAPSGQVVLVPPGVARQSVTTSSPATTLGVTPVDATLPSVRVRVSAGVAGRLLVLSAEQEAGWLATVDGRPVPIVPAWGHQIAVAVPTGVATVVVAYSSPVREILLLIEIAAVLFTGLTSIPGRRREPADTATRRAGSTRVDGPLTLPR